MQTLVELRLNSNDFTGSIPDEIGKAVNLKLLDLSNNRLSGVIPSGLSNLVSLTELYL